MKLHQHGVHTGVSMLLALAVLAGGLGLAPDAALAAPSIPSSFYYYADGQRIPLAVSTEWAAVKFADADPAQQAAALLEAGAPLDASAARRDLPNTGLSLLPIASGITPEALLPGLRLMRQAGGLVEQASPVFEAEDTELVLTDEFIATFRPGMSRAQIDRINARHGVSILSEVLDQPNTFVLQLPSGSEQDALAMSNLYKESGEALTAAPNFLMILPADPAFGAAPASSGPAAMTPDDALYVNQWALHNTGGVFITPDNDISAPEAWDVTLGNPYVKIAIVDYGVDLTHEDLNVPPKLKAGYDATPGNASAGAACAPSCGNADDYRGTAIASLAAAAGDNTIGMSGVCPGCSIIPVRIAVGNGAGSWVTTNATIANGITWAYLNGAWVINLSFTTTPATVITTAINNARTKGRGGKGTVVVGAAGDSGKSTVSYPASLSNVIAVGALNLCAARKLALDVDCDNHETSWASNYGSALDLMAPGVRLIAADRMGADGYGPGNYVDNFGGTAGAAPHVAGVAGLMLDTNFDLTAAQVQSLLTKNADDLGPPGKDAQTGFGRLNAKRAVDAAVALRSLMRVKIETAAPETFYMYPGMVTPQTYSPYGGPVSVGSVNGIMKVLASEYSMVKVVGQPTSYSEMLGLPKAQLTTEYWFPRYNSSNTPALDQWFILTNLDTVYSNQIEITLGSEVQQGSTLLPGETITRKISGRDVGPVRVRSTNGKKFLVSLGSATFSGPTQVGYSEMPGMPKSQLALEYYFPRYSNSAALTESLLLANAGLSTATVQVLSGNSLLQTYTLTKGNARRVAYTGLDQKLPLRVKCTNGVKIIAALSNTTPSNSYSEWMGVPKPKITSQYYFPYHNDALPSTLDQQFRFINVDSVPHAIEISMNGAVMEGFTLQPWEMRPATYGLSAGSFRVRSLTGRKFLAALESNLYNGGVVTSYSELMGLPYTLLSAEYWFPYYNNTGTTMNEGLNIGRP